ncbi:hypothetical protein E4H12_04595 [Candidatus Thorarchaeota archaeon]|nr:MAG: hypothetical protein E4H12_04595 [Candidatus Thorarchaeota archaeon]
MEDKYLRKIYPISWIIESPYFVSFIQEWISSYRDDLLVADFASGEHDRVPTFFTKELPRIARLPLDSEKRIVVFCTDIHALRLDSLLGKLEEDELLDNVRVVHAALETMDAKANLRTLNLDYIEGRPEIATWLDDFLISEERFPSDCFDIGILNTDIVGYMHEYYKEYSDAEKGLSKVWSLIHSGGLLIVTMPCLLYTIDNILVLEKIGFEFLQGIDINLTSGEKTFLEKDVPLEKLSNLGHYTFLLFSKS